MGYSGQEMTWHGFRTIASRCLNELGWHPDLIELQLAHAERNEVRSAYNRAQRLPERRTMMQVWADYLDRLREDRTPEKPSVEQVANPPVGRVGIIEPSEQTQTHSETISQIQVSYSLVFNSSKLCDPV
jgi:hypothetical protein